MDNLFHIEEWGISQTSFDPKLQKAAESIFSIGNGNFGQRANHEEFFSGETLQGNYVGGVYYPDKTRVGWWKNGYPEYFAKVLNGCNWSGLDIEVNGIRLDLGKLKIISFKRSLNFKTGLLSRESVLELKTGEQIMIHAERFCSMDNDRIGAISYSIKVLRGNLDLDISVFLDNDVRNEDSNYDEIFWDHVFSVSDDEEKYVLAKTKKSEFLVATSMFYDCKIDNQRIEVKVNAECSPLKICDRFQLSINEGQVFQINKVVSIVSSLASEGAEVVDSCLATLNGIRANSYEDLRNNHMNAWAEIWKNADITIKGDLAAQQAIRFNIFHLFQTYTGKNAKLNVGPKGFTGEKYGGATYWDTEAYCIPFFLKTAPSKVSRQLLKYRYDQLGMAIKNAEKLGFNNGAALFPMVTMNGEECHNEWEITFEEIHRNAAIVHAIHNYTTHTGDSSYLMDYGWEVVFGVARFWMQRFNWSERKNAYVMLGVTGPNEYENNVNNNWYTNYSARWCLKYALDVNLKLDRDKGLTEEEIDRMTDIVAKVYLPEDEKGEIFLQDDGFLDKELIPASEIPENERPINQYWSWDRILRSVYIKQADVLQGLYFFYDDFSKECVEANYRFYEPFTVHESSLSPCIHSILAARIGLNSEAYKHYLRTSRLDLDDYNKEVHEGLHITSMAGTWMSVVEGLAGVHVSDAGVRIAPSIPKNWEALSFQIIVNNQPLSIVLRQNEASFENLGDLDLALEYGEVSKVIKPKERVEFLMNMS